jgi:insulysin
MQKLLFLFTFSIANLFLNNSDLEGQEKADLPAEKQGYTLIADESTISIKTPSFSDRKTAKIKLDNGLEAYIISDPIATESAAALAVHVGSWSNPKDSPGLAHFLEHMLFLGTTKYPKESEYNSFVTQNGGYSNAYTANDHTAYMFTIRNQAFTEAIDRFSWFFKEPLFNPSGVSRELHAIQQEFDKNVEQDQVRKIQVMKELANETHPYSRFTMGNQSSLIDVKQEVLKEWYKDHYSSNIMHLAVYSSLPLEELIQIVVDDFKDIKNHNYTPARFSSSLFSPNTETKLISISPIKNQKTLSMTWELPSSFSMQLDTQPLSILGWLLGHEGEKSLLAELKRENLAESLSAGGYDLGNSNPIFSIEMALTKKGLAGINTCILRVYEALTMLQKNGIPPYIFDEMQTVERFQYEYQLPNKSFDMVSGHVRNMLIEPLATFPQKSSVITSFNPEEVAEALRYLTPLRCHSFLLAPPKLSQIPSTQKELWVGVEYAVTKLPKEVTQVWRQAQVNDAISLPDANKLIPRNLELVKQEEHKDDASRILSKPDLLFNDKDIGSMYYLPDTRYHVPEVVYNVKIHARNIDPSNARSVVFTELYIRSLLEELNSFNYNALLAGLSFDVSYDNVAIRLNFKGYSENAPLLYKEVLGELKTMIPSREKFELYKRSLSRKYQNFSKETPLTQCHGLLKDIIYKDFVSEHAKAGAISTITYQDFLNFRSELFEACYTEALFSGNLTKETALDLWNDLQTSLSSAPYPKSELVGKSILILPKHSGPFSITEKSSQAGNAAILAIQNGKYDFKRRAAQQILSKALEEPFFSTLRTKQQTGYIVYNGSQEIERQLLSFFAVQSSTHDGRDLLSRFELFIESYLQEIDKQQFAKVQFETIKNSLINLLSQRPRNLEEMATAVNLITFDYDADSDWMEKRIAGFTQLSYEEYINLAKEFLGRSNKQRLGVVIDGKDYNNSELNYKPISRVQTLRNMGHYEQRTQSN